MRFIVDTNIVLSALIKDGLSRKIISSQNLEFFSTDYVLEEIDKHMATIVKKSGICKDEIHWPFSLKTSRL